MIVKLNSIFICINIEIFLGYRKCFSITATLQHCNRESRQQIFLKKYLGAFVDRNGNVVPLHSDLRQRSLKKKIAIPKGKNCNP